MSNRDYLVTIDSGFGRKLFPDTVVVGITSIDVYGDKYEVVEENNKKQWRLIE